jgi:peptidylprolyl isomerase
MGFMMKQLTICLALVFTLIMGVPAMAQNATNPTDNATNQEKSEEHLILSLSEGDIVIDLAEDTAENHTARIKELANEGFYDDVIFHRVIPGFMAQTGDPTGTGRGGSGENIQAEFSDIPFERGTVGMARASDPDSADSQFFIMFDRAPHLDGKYTVIGQVVDGMDVVDNIAVGEPPENPDKIQSAEIIPSGNEASDDTSE